MGAAWERHAVCETALIVSHMAEEFRAFCTIRKFVTVFTTARHLFLFSPEPNYSSLYPAVLVL